MVEDYPLHDVYTGPSVVWNVLKLLYGIVHYTLELVVELYYRIVENLQNVKKNLLIVQLNYRLIGVD
jgi:hypothetical protein